MNFGELFSDSVCVDDSYIKGIITLRIFFTLIMLPVLPGHSALPRIGPFVLPS